MKNGIKQIIEKRISWPPNLPKFLDLASGIDTDAAFDRMIKNKPPIDDVEKYARQECGYACRTQLAEDKARSKFKSCYMKWHERNQRGEMPKPSQLAIGRVSTTKKTDHMVEERMRSNKPKTELELRIEALAKQTGKVRL